MSNIEVIRTYLQMVSPDQLKATLFADNRLKIEQVIECPPSFFRYLYSEGKAQLSLGRSTWLDK